MEGSEVYIHVEATVWPNKGSTVALRSYIVMSSGYHIEEMFTRDSKAAN